MPADFAFARKGLEGVDVREERFFLGEAPVFLEEETVLMGAGMVFFRTIPVA